MASNGVIALAHQYGYNFLLYYLGVVLMFVLAALLLMPLLRLCRVYQLASLADVLTFRFRSPWVGAAVTIAMCITLLPLLALQIQAVADSIHILAGDSAALALRRRPAQSTGAAVLHHHHGVFHPVRHAPCVIAGSQHRSGHRYRV